MQIILQPEQEQFIIKKLKQGKYKNVDELVATAFQLLAEKEYKEQKIFELRQKIAEGTQQIQQGKVVDGETVFQQLQDKLNKMEQD
jgi:antitoxin ParD1/3/4